MAKARVIVYKKDEKYCVHSRVAFTPEKEKGLDEMSDGKDVVISLTGEGEWEPVGRDFTDRLHEEVTQKAKDLGIERLHWIYGENKQS